MGCKVYNGKEHNSIIGRMVADSTDALRKKAIR